MIWSMQNISLQFGCRFHLRSIQIVEISETQLGVISFTECHIFVNTGMVVIVRAVAVLAVKEKQFFFSIKICQSEMIQNVCMQAYRCWNSGFVIGTSENRLLRPNVLVDKSLCAEFLWNVFPFLPNVLNVLF